MRKWKFSESQIVGIFKDAASGVAKPMPRPLARGAPTCREFSRQIRQRLYRSSCDRVLRDGTHLDAIPASVLPGLLFSNESENLGTPWHSERR